MLYKGFLWVSVVLCSRWRVILGNIEGQGYHRVLLSLHVHLHGVISKMQSVRSYIAILIRGPPRL